MTLLHEQEEKERKKINEIFFNGKNLMKTFEACVAFRELIVLTSPCRFLMKLIIVMDSRFSPDFLGIIIINYFHNSLIFSASIFGYLLKFNKIMMTMS